MATKSYVYSKMIKISRGDMSLLRAGKKSCTVRLGNASVGAPEIEMSDGRTSVRVLITKVDNSRTFEELTDSDAMAEGFCSREELLLDLRKYYPRVSAKDQVTVISFQLVAQTDTLFPS
jgi:hypothetical protein